MLSGIFETENDTMLLYRHSTDPSFYCLNLGDAVIFNNPLISSKF